jgi:site-specific DNA-methyltransferase (adenine-specific)
MIEMLNCDCMEYMATLPDNAFDLAIVDPPYGIELEGKNVIKNKSDSDKVFETMWDSYRPGKDYFDELARVSKNQIIWGGNYFLDELGFCKAPIIWDKLNGESLYADGEMAWTSAGLPRNLKIFRHQWCGAFKDSERGVVKIHPTQKPVALYKWLLSRYAKPGDRILDTHGGSGSICIACHDLGFDLTWMELDADYYKAACKRYQTHAAQASLFDPAELTKSTTEAPELFTENQ